MAVLERDGGGLVGDLMARVRQIQIRTHRLVDDALSGAYRSTFRGSGVEFEEVRPYEPGDDIRSIDWHRSARGQGAFVKKYVEERELVLMMLADTSRSMDFGSRELSKRELAAQFCALMSFVALRQQDRVGLRLFGSEPGLHLPAQKGAGAVARLVREVIAAPPTSGGADYVAVLEQAGRTQRRRALVFLVSDFLDLRGAEAPWIERLAAFARRHDVVLVRVLDPFEEELPAVGRIELEDLENGRVEELDTRSAKVRAAWAARAAERREVLAAAVSRAGVDLIELSTAVEVHEPVVRFFKRRRRRRSGK